MAPLKTSWCVGSLALLALGPRVAAALPPPVLSESSLCEGGLCEKLDMKYERFVDIQPGDQWGDAGGYCGSWASQRAFLGIGAWVSQQQVRDRTTHCNTVLPNGGHDSEILSCNIDEAWKNLKIDYDAFDYMNTGLPQTAAYAQWLKKQLVSGYVVAWMIMWNGQHYPIYNLTPPAGMYGHVEPVIGIQSNHPLDDETVYPDDTVLHYMDAGIKTLHRNISSLPCKWAGVGTKADCGGFSYGISNPYGFGWAAKGFTQDPMAAVSARAVLKVDPWEREPDTRNGTDHSGCLTCDPVPLTGTLTATKLSVGMTYDIYRWDSVEMAFTYIDEYKKTSFTATADKYVFFDNKTFWSDGTTYYRVIARGKSTLTEK